MALRDKNTAASAAAFEDMDENTVAAFEGQDDVSFYGGTTTNVGQPIQAIAPATSREIAAPAPARAMPVMGLLEFKDAMPALEFGVLPRLVASNGNFLDPDKKALGSEIRLELLSWNDTFVLSPGDDSEAAKKATRFSRDGISINDSGESCAEYLRYLREDLNYPKAAMKVYVELVGFLVSTNGKAGELNGQMVMVSLSPQSRKRFQAYQLQLAVKARQGKVAADAAPILTLRCEVTSMGGKNFTLVKISD